MNITTSKVFFYFCLILFIFVWLIRYEAAVNPKITQADVSYFNNSPKIELIGVVKRVESRVKNNRLIVEAEKIKVQKIEKEVKGRVMVFIPRLVEVDYGDRIKLSGRLEYPELFNGFNWSRHLANEGIYSVMFSPWVTVIEENQGSLLMTKLYSLNSFFQEKINRLVPYPESTILSAMLLGNQGEIPDKINDSFRQTGIGHILSISGMHITLISIIIFWFILSLGLWRKQAFILTSLFLFFFILMVGAPPPAIRAGIMGFLFLLAQYFGRAYSFQNAIIAAAALILIFNPLSLFYDISFQLSFISVLAMLWLFPIFQHYVFQKTKLKTEKRPFLAFFLNTFLISLAILLFLGPLTAYYFNNFPIISPLSNFLAIPFSSLILFFGIIFLLASLIFLPLAAILGNIVYILIYLMIYLNNFLANIPFLGAFQFYVSLHFLIIYYIILLFFIFKLKKSGAGLNPAPQTLLN